LIRTSVRTLLGPLSLLIAATIAAAPAHAFEVLTVGKTARFKNVGDPARNGGTISVGADRALQVLTPPTCPATSAVEIEAYLQSTVRDSVLAHVDLDCAKWSAYGSRYRYFDPAGTVRSIRYSQRGLRIDIRGAGFTPIDGPVAYLQGQLTIGARTLRARFHNFAQNDGRAVASRRPSAAAAAGEAGFWDALTGDASSEADEQATLAQLQQAVARDPRDGRSYFLIAMMHLYRFGQRVVNVAESSPEAHAELVASNAAFAAALPLLWDDATATGDSRVPGFAGAGTFTQGAVENDPVLRARGLAELRRSLEVNDFFNIFDFIPVLQVLPPSDPAFTEAFAFVSAYLTDPATLQCVGTQPELCANAGFAPRNLQGSLTLFGDLYVKHGDLASAQGWYNLVASIPGTATWPFKSALDERIAHTAERVALYQDADPSNDPPLIGAGAEACAVCHVR
jgi:hypothetical protein